MPFAPLLFSLINRAGLYSIMLNFNTTASFGLCDLTFINAVYTHAKARGDQARTSIRCLEKFLTLSASCVIKTAYIEHDHIQAKGIPFNSGADPPL